MHRACCFWCKNKQSKNEFLLSVATKTCQSTKYPSVTQNVSKEKANLLHWGVFKNTSSSSFQVLLSGGSEQQTHPFCIVTPFDPFLDWDEQLAISPKEEAMVQ